MGQTPKKERKQIILRLSPELYEALNRWADDEFRSVNGQIEYLLTDACQKQGRLKKQKPNQEA